MHVVSVIACWSDTCSRANTPARITSARNNSGRSVVGAGSGENVAGSARSAAAERARDRRRTRGALATPLIKASRSRAAAGLVRPSPKARPEERARRMPRMWRARRHTRARCARRVTSHAGDRKRSRSRLMPDLPCAHGEAEPESVHVSCEVDISGVGGGNKMGATGTTGATGTNGAGVAATAALTLGRGRRGRQGSRRGQGDADEGGRSEQRLTGAKPCSRKRASRPFSWPYAAPCR
jgi:hypothetical protein